MPPQKQLRCGPKGDDDVGQNKEIATSSRRKPRTRTCCQEKTKTTLLDRNFVATKSFLHVP